MDSPLTVDDLVTRRVAETLGEACIPTAAILIVQYMRETSDGIQYVTAGLPGTWVALGMLRSVQLHLEAGDLTTWGEE